MPAARTITIDNFRGGEFGDLHPSTAPPNTFTGRNVVVYRDGLIGPRAGVKKLAPTLTANGSVIEFGIAKGTNGVVYSQSTNVHGFTFPNGAVALLGTVAAAPSQGDGHMVRVGNDILYYNLSGANTYQITPATPTVADMTGAPAAIAVVQNGERVILIGNTGGKYRRLRYSAKADPTSWPAANFIDIPYPNTAQEGFSLTHIAEIRQRLVIANDGGEWWALTGVPGVNDVLRRQQRADRTPANRHHAARIGEALYLVVVDGSDLPPVIFTGTTTEKDTLRHLGKWNNSNTVARVAARPGVDHFLALAANGRALASINGTWTFHQFAQPIAYPFIDSNADSQQLFIFCDGGGASAPPLFYAFDSDLNRPAKTSDTYASPGDDSTTPVDAEFTTAVQWAKDGDELNPRWITVNFAKWNTGSTARNHFDLEVIMHHRHNQAGTRVATVPLTWDEMASATTSDATPDSARFNVGAQGPGQGFQIRVSNMRGVAVRNIIVEPKAIDR